MKRTRVLVPATSLLALLLLAGCRLAPIAQPERLAGRLDEILTRLDHTGAIVTARVVTLPRGTEVYARDADVPYTPASNMKLPISAAGLDRFGPEHTFATYLALDGDDLWVVGTGDPGLGDPRLAGRRGETPVSVFDGWADALQARGATAITGDLVYYDRALDGQWTHFTWGNDVLHWYGAATTGLNFNDNCVDITVIPTEPGQAPRLDVMPPTQDVTIINECVTGAEHDPRIEKLPGVDTIRVFGTCAKRETLKSKPVENPGRFTCDALRTHLAARGITIAGGIRRADAPPGGTLPPPPEMVVAVARTPVQDILDRVNTNSQNFFAEALCKLTGQAYLRALGVEGAGSWLAGELAVRDFLQRQGIDHRHFVLADGSGLSDDNRVTARLLTDLLRAMYRHPERDVYVDSLAKGGVNGTLEQRFAGYDGHVFAKTGYIGGVRALSGYVRTRDDDWLAFSIIYNHISGSVKPYEELQDEAVKLLVDWPAGERRRPAGT